MPEEVLREPPLGCLPTCLFPVSASTTYGPNTLPRESLTLPLNGRWDHIESRFEDQGIAFPSILKATWAITLQFYVPSEITCFEYRRQGVSIDVNPINNGVDLDEMRHGSMLCLLRLNDAETLLGLMKRLGKGRFSPCLSLPVGQDVLYVSAVPLANFWNTSLIFRDQMRGEPYPGDSMVSFE